MLMSFSFLITIDTCLMLISLIMWSPPYKRQRVFLALIYIFYFCCIFHQVEDWHSLFLYLIKYQCIYPQIWDEFNEPIDKWMKHLCFRTTKIKWQVKIYVYLKGKMNEKINKKLKNSNTYTHALEHQLRIDVRPCRDEFFFFAHRNTIDFISFGFSSLWFLCGCDRGWWMCCQCLLHIHE